jgi:protein-tyrosine phosphatase
MVRVLFVCLGNICRSPIAQGVFENVVRREGLEEEVLVDSAGTGAWHVGHPPDERAQRERGLAGFGPQHTAGATGNARRLPELRLHPDDGRGELPGSRGTLPEGSAEVRPFLDYAPNRAEREVPDPFYGGPEGFEHVLDLVEEASEGFLQNIRK